MLDGAVISDFWVGKEADIRGCGGRISANLKENFVRTIARYSRQQEEDSNVVTKFVVEKAPGAYAENFVAFRVKGTKLYLTMNQYGDEVSRGISRILSHTSLLPDNIPIIVNYTVDKESRNGNFEGQGFNYCPMTAELGPPGLLQVFKLEKVINNDKRKVGIKSKFGTYW